MKTGIINYALISCLGSGKEEHLKIFKNGCNGLKPEILPDGKKTYTGRINQQLEDPPADLSEYNSRNNRLLLSTYRQLDSEVTEAINKYGPEKVGVILGTSTSGMSDAENAFKHRTTMGELPSDFDYKQSEMGSAAEFLQKFLNLSGPAYMISCACSSGAKALASAARLIHSGVCDAVITGGVDTLCGLTLCGFSSLEAIDNERCNPFSVNRQGINVGEAAALFLLSKEDSQLNLIGYGESSDAHHHSAPHPNGEGAEASMRKALQQSQLSPSQIDYINLHGTGTELNDSMEAKAVSRIFDKTLPCSSTKSLTGHTLGAAGALEAAFCCLALDHQKIPIHKWDNFADPEIPSLNFSAVKDKPIKAAMSNSFAFGGNNCSLVIVKEND